MASTRWPRMSTIGRSVCRKAARASPSESEAWPLKDLAHVGVHAQPDAAEETADQPAGAHDAVIDQEREHELRPRKAGGAQQRADLPAQAAAAHEDEPLAMLGELVGELHGHAAAQGMPDEGRALMPQRQ